MKKIDINFYAVEAFFLFGICIAKKQAEQEPLYINPGELRLHLGGGQLPLNFIHATSRYITYFINIKTLSL